MELLRGEGNLFPSVFAISRDTLREPHKEPDDILLVFQKITIATHLGKDHSTHTLHKQRRQKSGYNNPLNSETESISHCIQRRSDFWEWDTSSPTYTPTK